MSLCNDTYGDPGCAKTDRKVETKMLRSLKTEHWLSLSLYRNTEADRAWVRRVQHSYDQHVHQSHVSQRQSEYLPKTKQEAQFLPTGIRYLIVSD
jgi:hypothetical protein